MSSPASQDHAGRRRWLGWALAGIVGAALLATALWLCVAVIPQRLYPPLSNAELAGLSPAEQAARREGRDKLQNDARTTLLQGLAALLVLGGAGIGAAVTLRQVRISREQLEQARQQAQLSDERAREQLGLAREEARRSDERLREQIAVAQEGQITERFTRAVDQLGQPGPDRLDVRLGGIYALERIAHDSPTHRLAVVEILTAFIRSHAPWPPRLPGQYRADAPIDHVPSLQTRAPDIQAALTIIGRRPTQKDDPHPDLNQTDLRHANLYEADLTGARFVGANLTKAQLHGANLTKTLLTTANLTSAWLDSANLTAAQLGGANLISAQFQAANLTEAWLVGADLTSAYLGGADLTGAQLDVANLTAAQLGGANLTDAQLGSADLTDAQLGGANLTRAQLRRANLTRAQLRRANLTQAWLGRANLTSAQLRRANLTGAELGEALANGETVWPNGWDRTRRATAGIDEPDEEAPRTASPPK
jgi:uncharacterized protein YjbI with pentapeptide repeats